MMGVFAFARPNDDVRVVGNYSFRWTKDHIPKDETEHLRQTYDKVGAAAVARIQEIHQRGLIEKSGNAAHLSKLDLFAVLQEHREQDEALGHLWDEVHTVPDWVDWEQLARGQRFFYRYALANLMGFALQGFVGENSASAGVVEVLVRTGGFSTRVLLRRLLETFQMVLEVTHSLEYIRPGGRGHTTAVRVRLLHSMVRQRILKIVQQKGPSYYDVERYGVPINTLDSLHALTTFGCNHAFIQLPLMGISVPQQEIEDYVALWRYIGHVLGTPTDHFTSAARAKILMESMSFNERLVTDMSLVAGHNFVETVRDLPPVNLSAGFIEAGSRVLNGDALCDQLGMGRPGVYHYACFRGFCWLGRTLAAVQRWFPRAGEGVVDFNREMLHKAIIQSQGGLGGGSKMEFKHVPDGTLTKKEDGLGKGVQLRFYQRPLDLVCFICFVFGSLLVAGGLIVAVKVAMKLVASGYPHILM
ncbi:transcriptional regulator [Colletotrichum sublineola]|uniref:Putative transcriptional regulator n=1 Tax=Colletotrichum sublineola TaxID=1173701 RepID=A0A066Y2I9_COLSU|nr:transcriptional regulator [Colletotrichum sublineola]KDN72256.1 putative transcriptional regulator [Colletotrichum sublineola]